MHQWQAWLVAALLLFVAEMAAPGFWLLSVAVGCLAAGLVSLVAPGVLVPVLSFAAGTLLRSEEHTSELQSLAYLVCRLLLEKKKAVSTYFSGCQVALRRAVIVCILV